VYKSQVAFEDLYWMQTSLIINSTEACYSDVGLFTGRRLQRRQRRPLDARWGRRVWRRRDHWCV